MKRMASKVKVLVIIAMMMIVSAMPVQAATKKQKVMAAYKKFLSQGTIYLVPDGYKYWTYKYNWYHGSKGASVKFMTGCIDGDSIPELIVAVTQYPETTYAIYTCKKGKVVRAYYDTDLGYASFRGYYKKSGVVQARHTTEGTPYYTNNFKPLAGKKLVCRYYTDRYSGGYKNDYNISQGGGSKAAYNNLLKKATKGKKLTKAKFHANTAANRNTYLK